MFNDLGESVQVNIAGIYLNRYNVLLECRAIGTGEGMTAERKLTY